MNALLDDKAHVGSVLIVEDDRELAEILSRKLKNEGFKTVTAEGTRDAIQKLRNERFDCVILDMILKTGHGEELIPALRSHWKGGLVPVVVTSGSLDTELVKRLATHVKAVFVKPYEMDVVVQKVVSVVIAPR